jgi:hypothetical protein
MQKRFLTLIAMLCHLSSAGVYAGARNNSSVIMPPAVEKMHNNINVLVHPQVELISIVQTIGGYPRLFPFLMSEQGFPYIFQVMEHFRPFAGHAVVQMFDRLSAQPSKLNFSAPSNIMLYTDANLQVRNDIVLDDFVISRIEGMDSLQVFLDLLRDFAITSGFNEFFRAYEDFYKSIIGQTIETLGDFNYIEELESFYGHSQQSYNIILVALYNSVGFGNSNLFQNGKREIFSTLGSGRLRDGLPCFGNERHLKYMTRHEFSHPFVNPITEQYQDEVIAFEANFENLPKRVHQIVCGEWEECINEFVIRAITTWLAKQECPELGEWAYNYELNRGVVYLDELLEKIQFYQANRDQYPTLNDFYPRLLEVFLTEKF